MKSELTRRQQLAVRKEEDEWRRCARAGHYRSQADGAQATKHFLHYVPLSPAQRGHSMMVLNPHTHL